MRVDHMLLIYLVVALVICMALLVALLVKLGRQLIQAQKLTTKLDSMINQVLAVGDKSDYRVRSSQFH
jgi:hypothetical protein